MADIKITTHTTYTYETSDGREFSIAEEAQEWQDAIDTLRDIAMLDHELTPTMEVASAYYVHIKTNSQLAAFEKVQAYEGMCSHIPHCGIWYYDDHTDSYVDLEKEINYFQKIKAMFSEK